MKNCINILVAATAMVLFSSFSHAQQPLLDARLQPLTAHQAVGALLDGDGPFGVLAQRQAPCAQDRPHR